MLNTALRYWNQGEPWQQALVVVVVVSWAAIILCLVDDWRKRGR